MNTRTYLQTRVGMSLLNPLCSRKINIWSGFIILSPELGPFTAAFITWHLSWKWCYWVYSILNAVGLILIIALADETYYNRALPAEQQPPRKSRLLRLLGIEQGRSSRSRRSLIKSIQRPLIVISKLPVLLIVIYY